MSEQAIAGTDHSPARMIGLVSLSPPLLTVFFFNGGVSRVISWAKSRLLKWDLPGPTGPPDRITIGGVVLSPSGLRQGKTLDSAVKSFDAVHDSLAEGVV